MSIIGRRTGGLSMKAKTTIIGFLSGILVTTDECQDAALELAELRGWVI